MKKQLPSLSGALRLTLALALCAALLLCLGQAALAQTVVLENFTFTIPDELELNFQEHNGFQSIMDDENWNQHELSVGLGHCVGGESYFGLTLDWIYEQLDKGDGEYMQNLIHGQPTLFLQAVNEEVRISYALAGIKMNDRYIIGFEKQTGTTQPIGDTLLEIISSAEAYVPEIRKGVSSITPAPTPVPTPTPEPTPEPTMEPTPEPALTQKVTIGGFTLSLPDTFEESIKDDNGFGYYDSHDPHHDLAVGLGHCYDVEAFFGVSLDWIRKQLDRGDGEHIQNLIHGQPTLFLQTMHENDTGEYAVALAAIKKNGSYIIGVEGQSNTQTTGDLLLKVLSSVEYDDSAKDADNRRSVVNANGDLLSPATYFDGKYEMPRTWDLEWNNWVEYHFHRTEGVSLEEAEKDAEIYRNALIESGWFVPFEGSDTGLLYTGDKKLEAADGRLEGEGINRKFEGWNASVEPDPVMPIASAGIQVCLVNGLAFADVEEPASDQKPTPKPTPKPTATPKPTKAPTPTPQPRSYLGDPTARKASDKFTFCGIDWDTDLDTALRTIEANTERTMKDVGNGSYMGVEYGVPFWGLGDSDCFLTLITVVPEQDGWWLECQLTPEQVEFADTPEAVFFFKDVERALEAYPCRDILFTLVVDGEETEMTDPDIMLSLWEDAVLAGHESVRAYADFNNLTLSLERDLYDGTSYMTCWLILEP